MGQLRIVLELERLNNVPVDCYECLVRHSDNLFGLMPEEFCLSNEFDDYLRLTLITLKKIHILKKNFIASKYVVGFVDFFNDLKFLNLMNMAAGFDDFEDFEESFDFMDLLYFKDYFMNLECFERLV